MESTGVLVTPTCNTGPNNFIICMKLYLIYNMTETHSFSFSFSSPSSSLSVLKMRRCFLAGLGLSRGLHLGQNQSPRGTLTSFGFRQYMWCPLLQPSHSNIFSGSPLRLHRRQYAFRILRAHVILLSATVTYDSV